MRKSAIALVALSLFGAVTATLPAPAEARDWDHGWRGETWRAPDRDRGPAVALGIVGSIIAGAAIATAASHAPPAYPYYYYGPYAGYGYYYQ